MDKFMTIDEYIAAQPAQVQPILQAVRATIRAAAPEATEKMSWQMPTFWQGENIIHFAAFKNHLSIFPGGEASGVFADRLAGYETTKGAIRFPLDRAIDHALIADIVRWRLEQAKGDKPASAQLAARARYPMPDFVAAALDERDLWARYNVRPPYQRNDYVGWIASAKREETRQKRLEQMLNELQAGDAYMGMAYDAK